MSYTALTSVRGLLLPGLNERLHQAGLPDDALDIQVNFMTDRLETEGRKTGRRVLFDRTEIVDGTYKANFRRRIAELAELEK